MAFAVDAPAQGERLLVEASGLIETAGRSKIASEVQLGGEKVGMYRGQGPLQPVQRHSVEAASLVRLAQEPDHDGEIDPAGVRVRVLGPSDLDPAFQRVLAESECTGKVTVQPPIADEVGRRKESLAVVVAEEVTMAE